jgi:ParB/RepB/Spo0J family partition protein
VIPVVNRSVREIPVAIIDDPELTMRESFDEEDLRELVDDIRVNGVQVPLIVEPVGTRFRVIAGHRRITAARALHADTVPCDVRQGSDVDAEAIKILENDVREQVNAAETAVYLMRLFETRAENDVDKLCAIVRRSRSYVDDRLLLIQGDADVLNALRKKRVTFAVAKELNRVRDVGYRRLFLQNAIDGAASAKVVRQWREQNDLLAGAQPKPDPAAAGVDAVAVSPAPSHLACVVCKQVENTNRLKLVYVHDYCELAVLDPALRNFRESIAGGADA